MSHRLSLAPLEAARLSAAHANIAAILAELRWALLAHGAAEADAILKLREGEAILRLDYPNGTIEATAASLPEAVERVCAALPRRKEASL